MHDGDDRRAAPFLLGHQFDDDCAVAGVERSGRFVQEEDRQIGDEAACDIDTLLLTAGERRRRQRPEPLRNVEPSKQIGRLAPRGLPRQPGDDQRFRDHVDRRYARNSAQKLADITQRISAHRQNAARLRGGDIERGAALADQDAACVAAISAEDHLQDRALAGARRTGKDGAFPRSNRERDAGHDRQAHAAAQVHGERLRYSRSARARST